MLTALDIAIAIVVLALILTALALVIDAIRGKLLG
jgi:hypothetical protein